MPLVIAPLNKDLKIIKISADTKVKKHLENLGITLSSSIRILDNKGGNTILLLKGCRLALDRDISSRIFVA